MASFTRYKKVCRDSNHFSLSFEMWNDTPKVCFMNFLAKESYLFALAPNSAEALAEKEREGKFTASVACKMKTF